MRWRWVAATLALPLGACEVFGPQDCTLSIEPAIVVWITDAETGEPRADGASGYVADGEYVDSLQASHFDGDNRMTARRAADERAGSYDVVVQHPGYETWYRVNVRVNDDECHVQTRELDAELEPVE